MNYMRFFLTLSSRVPSSVRIMAHDSLSCKSSYSSLQSLFFKSFYSLLYSLSFKSFYSQLYFLSFKSSYSSLYFSILIIAYLLFNKKLLLSWKFSYVRPSHAITLLLLIVSLPQSTSTSQYCPSSMQAILDLSFQKIMSQRQSRLTGRLMTFRFFSLHKYQVLDVEALSCGVMVFFCVVMEQYIGPKFTVASKRSFQRHNVPHVHLCQARTREFVLAQPGALMGNHFEVFGNLIQQTDPVGTSLVVKLSRRRSELWRRVWYRWVHNATIQLMDGLSVQELSRKYCIQADKELHF